jgi:CBS domain-containing protein
MKLGEIATKPVATIRAGDEIDAALTIMEALEVRHLPVVRSDGVCIGMISDRDVLEAVGGLPRQHRLTLRHGAATANPTRVEQIMSIPSTTLLADDRLERAIELMLDKRIDAVPIVLKQLVTGIVTSTDILRRFLDDRSEPRGGWRFQRIESRMSRRIVTLRPEETLEAARRLIRQKQIRHIPILENGLLVGIVSDRDVRCALGEGGAECASERTAPLRISDIMTREVVSIDPRNSLADAAECMLARRFGCLPVVQAEQLVGILTQSDLLRAMADACRAPRRAIVREGVTGASALAELTVDDTLDAAKTEISCPSAESATRSNEGESKSRGR